VYELLLPDLITGSKLDASFIAVVAPDIPLPFPDLPKLLTSLNIEPG
jgi:hypothetical protein